MADRAKETIAITINRDDFEAVPLKSAQVVGLQEVRASKQRRGKKN